MHAKRARTTDDDSGRKRTWPVATAFVAVILGAVFLTGLQAGTRLAMPISAVEMHLYRAELAEQSQALGELRASAAQTLDVLVQRVARLQAHVLRLDAFGGALTQLADLDVGEFDFNGPLSLNGSLNGGLNGIQEYVRTADEEHWGYLFGTMNDLAAQIDRQETELGVLETLMLDQDLRARIQPQGSPIAAGATVWLSSGFGRRVDPITDLPSDHWGLDFAGPVGTEIVSIADGVVTFSGERTGYGLTVEINHGNGYSTRYAHNSELLVQPGDIVSRGQLISLMGATGRVTGPHLHLEVLRNGQAVNPVSYVNRGP